MDECKVCANADSEYCFACDNGNQFKPMTNADRIRAMSDEELAGKFEEIQLEAVRAYGNDNLLLKGELKGYWLDWLKQASEAELV